MDNLAQIDWLEKKFYMFLICCLKQIHNQLAVYNHSIVFMDLVHTHSQN